MPTVGEEKREISDIEILRKTGKLEFNKKTINKIFTKPQVNKPI